MILLDTNVVSEPMRPAPAAAVVRWLDGQPMETLFLSAISVAEMRAGVMALPEGKRRSSLQSSLENRVLPLFTGRVLAFDQDCTSAYADILRRTRQRGNAISTADALIASVAAAYHFSVATRDVAPFAAAGLPVINPWEEGA